MHATTSKGDDVNRPRVTASHAIEAKTMRALCEHSAHTTPGVLVEVAFDLHDHDAALQALDDAVAQVRTQIEETT